MHKTLSTMQNRQSYNVHWTWCKRDGFILSNTNIMILINSYIFVYGSINHFVQMNVCICVNVNYKFPYNMRQRQINDYELWQMGWAEMAKWQNAEFNLIYLDRFELLTPLWKLNCVTDIGYAALHCAALRRYHLTINWNGLAWTREAATSFSTVFH